MIPARPHDWSDTHEGRVRPSVTTAREAFHEDLAKMPGWARIALDLRNRAMRPFGLKTEGDGGSDLMSTLPVLEDTPDRYTVALADRHLTFALTTELKDSQAAITTRIWFNHLAGRAYLAAVLIPHKLILRHALRSLV